MKLYSTNNKLLSVSLKEAVLHSLPPDKGLYMPHEIPKIEASFFKSIHDRSFQEISFHVARNLIGNYIPENRLKEMVYEAINFSAPVVMLEENIGTLELFHGPSLAFKDFGARFMSRLMSYFNEKDDKELTILVATSGDTGGAVAAGFYDTPGIEVVILYPSGKVSDLQEKQLTTLGKNITACEIEGTFDDCQAMVKQAFLDKDLASSYQLSSANSINIARLIPQSFYYFEAYKQASRVNEKVVFSVPSGNFGNLTAGLMAKRMGLPVEKFIAATNVNKVVPEYLLTGKYTPKPSIATISNAMDVGNPSNFVRIMDLYSSDYQRIIKDIEGSYFTDKETTEAMKKVFSNHGYYCDPHGAVGYLALKQYMKRNDSVGIFLETAHPGKFLPTVESALNTRVPLPDALLALRSLKKQATLLDNNYKSFKDFLFQRKRSLKR